MSELMLFLAKSFFSFFMHETKELNLRKNTGKVFVKKEQDGPNRWQGGKEAWHDPPYAAPWGVYWPY
jgi:hypothetical protein